MSVPITYLQEIRKTRQAGAPKKWQMFFSLAVSARGAGWSARPPRRLLSVRPPPPPCPPPSYLYWEESGGVLYMLFHIPSFVDILGTC